jgi:hypothetical protein
MIRSSFVVFIIGWIAWFTLDKPRPEYGPLPHASENLLDNFQLAFNMIKAGHLEHASLLVGALLAMLFASVSEHLGRRRMRRLMMPGRKAGRQTGGKNAEPESPSTPARTDEPGV